MSSKQQAISSSLDEIVKYAQGAFVHAKSDGVLEAGEVVQIAVGVAGKLHALGQLSGQEKKSVVLYCLKKGLDAAGGVGELPGLKDAPPETRKAVEDQLLAAAGAAIDMAVAVARGKIDLRKDGVKACIPLCLSAASVAKALLPKEAAIVKNAISWAEDYGKAYAAAQGIQIEEPVSAATVALPQIAAPIQVIESVVAAVAAPAPAPEVQEQAVEAPPATESQTEPSPEASAEETPSKTTEVRFE